MFNFTTASKLAVGDLFILIETGEELQVTQLVGPVAFARRTHDGFNRWFRATVDCPVAIIQ